MISYEELCEAIERWRARMYGEPDPQAPVQVSAAQQASVAEEPSTENFAGSTPEPAVSEHTNEIDLDSVDVVDG